MNKLYFMLIILAAGISLASKPILNLDASLSTQLENLSNGEGLDFFIFPEDLAEIPSDPNNPITEQKIELGKLLFHESGLLINPQKEIGTQTGSCASCHFAGAGFQANRIQGIGEGGEGAIVRIKNAEYEDTEIDVQPIRSPSSLNTAYQKNMLWNGQFGATGVNVGTEGEWTIGTPIEVNFLGYEGVETQAIAGLEVHRMDVNLDLLETLGYKSLFDEVFPDIDVSERYTKEFAGLAIAAYERSVLANEAPFQEWLKGNLNAMTEQQKLGAQLFFGDAQCHTCHTGPALNSMSFHALGVKDLYQNDLQVFNANISSKENFGRGGFTGENSDLYKFKTPQLYNLKDSPFLGHGSSFSSVQEIIEYKNAGEAENPNIPVSHLSPLFTPLNLSSSQILLLTDFIENALYDPDLKRYEPSEVLSETCIPFNDFQSQVDLNCTDPCDEVLIEPGNNSITVSNLDITNSELNVYTSSWELIYGCAGNCGSEQTISGLDAGEYIVRIKLYASDWSPLCVRVETITVSEGGTNLPDFKITPLIVTGNRGTNDISIVNTVTDESFTIEVPGSAPNSPDPMYVNFDPHSERVFIGDRGNNRTIALDANDFSFAGEVNFGPNAGMFHMWLSPNGNQLWIVNDISKELSVVNPQTLELITTIPIPSDLSMGKPHDIIISPDNLFAYVSIIGIPDENYVIQYSTSTFEETGRATVGIDPHVSLTDKNHKLYVACQGADAVYILDRYTMVVEEIVPFENAHGVGMSNSGNYLYVGNIADGGSNAIGVLDLTNDSPVGIPGDVNQVTPHNLALTPDDSKLYITHTNENVSVLSVYNLNPSTGALINHYEIPIGSRAMGLATLYKNEISLSSVFNQTISATSANGAVATYNAPTATTTCGSGGLNIEMISGLPSGSEFPVGITPIVFEATDNCGNSARISFAITVTPFVGDLCDEVLIEPGNNSITVSNLDLTNSELNVYTSSWELIYGCAGNCGSEQTISGLDAGEYIVRIKLYASDWSPLCVRVESVMVTSSNSLSVYSQALNLESIQEERNVKLIWLNNSQEVNDYFVIERSFDNIIFTELETVDGSGIENSLTLYNYRDENPLEGDNYYRIKLVFKNGEVRYSNFQYEKFEKIDDFLLFPNPTESVINIDMKNWIGKNVNIMIVNNSGKIVFTDRLENISDSIQPFDLSFLDNGSYYIFMRTDDNLKTSMKFEFLNTK